MVNKSISSDEMAKLKEEFKKDPNIELKEDGKGGSIMFLTKKKTLKQVLKNDKGI